MTLRLQENVLLAPFTTLGIGGAASYLVVVSSREEVVEAVALANEKALPVLVIGSGSNILVPDEGFEGLVIVLDIQGITIVAHDTQTEVVCGAGELLDDVVATVVAAGHWGLENLSAIPGTVGATPVQNVGAYGVEVGEYISQVEAVDTVTGELRIFGNQDCAFAYRDSYFKTEEGRRWIITTVTFSLPTTQSPQLTYGSLTELTQLSELQPHTVREAVKEIRSSKFPDWHREGTAGSFFKNPIITNEKHAILIKQYPELPSYPVAQGVKISLGYVLDKICGLRGYRSGNVRLYENQALVLVVDKGASANEVKLFVANVSNQVKEKIAVEIEPEVLIL